MARKVSACSAVITGAVLILASVAGCGDASGCDAFDPKSKPLTVGQSVEAEVEIVGGGWATPDIAGAYWSAEQPAPPGAPSDGFVTGTATLVSASGFHDGVPSSGVVSIDFGNLGVVQFTGPIGCE